VPDWRTCRHRRQTAAIRCRLPLIGCPPIAPAVSGVTDCPSAQARAERPCKLGPETKAFGVAQRASVPAADVVWRVGKHTILAATGIDGVPSDAQSMFAKTGKHTQTWQTYFRCQFDRPDRPKGQAKDDTVLSRLPWRWSAPMAGARGCVADCPRAGDKRAPAAGTTGANDPGSPADRRGVSQLSSVGLLADRDASDDQRASHAGRDLRGGFRHHLCFCNHLR
jgi:hypothetical protein